MARKVVVVELCVRCPIGREMEATRTEVLCLGDTRFQLRLCEKHGEDLVRDVFAWGRLGDQLEDLPKAGRYGADYAEAHRRAADLRAQQAQEDRARETRTTPVTKAPTASLRGLPHDAGEWVFTEHARERLAERGVDVVDALRAACDPSQKHVNKPRPGRTSPTWIHIGPGAKVVVDHLTKEILTVAIPDQQARKAQ